MFKSILGSIFAISVLISSPGFAKQELLLEGNIETHNPNTYRPRTHYFKVTGWQETQNSDAFFVVEDNDGNWSKMELKIVKRCRGKLGHLVYESVAVDASSPIQAMRLQFVWRRANARRVLTGLMTYSDGTQDIIRGRTQHHPRWPQPELPICAEYDEDRDEG